MNYDIIATLGPASADTDIWQKMFSAGVTAFRLNTSHLSIQQLKIWLERYQVFINSAAFTPALVLDLQGSKWRLGDFPSFTLDENQNIDLILASSTEQPHTLPVPHADFFKAASLSNGEVILNDAKTRLIVKEINDHLIKTQVVKGGSLSAHKGITFSHCQARKEALNDKDQAILDLTRGLPFIRYAVSYIKDAIEMGAYRSFLGKDVYLIAKLERQPAINEAADIALHANELWLCRGDMGAELGISEMAKTVHLFSKSLNRFSVPVFLAGQVFEHMVDHPAPTRSEVCFLYDAIINGYQGVVLSDEAAVGQYPLESCRAAALFKDRPET